MSFYAFWIPIGFGTAAVFGLLGLIYGCVLAASELVLPINGSLHEFVVGYVRRLLCGAIAGGAIGFASFRHRIRIVSGAGRGDFSGGVGLPEFAPD